MDAIARKFVTGMAAKEAEDFYRVRETARLALRLERERELFRGRGLVVWFAPDYPYPKVCIRSVDGEKEAVIWLCASEFKLEAENLYGAGSAMLGERWLGESVESAAREIVLMARHRVLALGEKRERALVCLEEVRRSAIWKEDSPYRGGFRKEGSMQKARYDAR